MGTEPAPAPIDLPIDSRDVRRVRAMLDGAIACVAELCGNDDNASPMLLLHGVRARLHEWEQQLWEREQAAAEADDDDDDDDDDPGG